MTALFSQIWHAGLTAGFVVLGILMLRLCFHKAPRWMAVALWGLVAVRLLCPVSFTSPVSVVPSLPEAVIFDAPMQETGDVVSSETITPEANEAPNVEETPTIPSETKVTLSLETVAAAVWVTGVAAMLAYAVVSTMRLRRRVRTATKLDGRVYESEAVTSPFILGVFRPKVYLPYGLDGAVKDSVIAHESAHLKRCDHLIKPLGFLLLSVYWFQPLLWAAYVCLCRDIEAACDEKAIKTLGEDARREYSYALVTLGVKDRRRIAACPLAFGEVGVKERVKRVMSYKKPTVWILSTALVLSSVAAVCLLTDRAPEEGGATLEGATLRLRSQELETQYKRSRSNDVPVEKGRRSAVRDHSDDAFFVQIKRVNERDMSVTVDLCREVIVDGHKTDRVTVPCDEKVTMQSVDGGAEYTLSLCIDKGENPATQIESMLSYQADKKIEYGNDTMTLSLTDDAHFTWKIDSELYSGTYTLTDDTLTLIENGRLSVTVFDIDKTDGTLRYNKRASYRHKRASFPTVAKNTALAFHFTYEIEEKDEELHECVVRQFDGTVIYSMSSAHAFRPSFSWVGNGYVSMSLTSEVEKGVYRTGQEFIHVPSGEKSEYYNQVVYASKDVVAGLWEEDGKCGVYVAQATFCGTPPLPEKHRFVLEDVDSLAKASVEAYADERDLIVTYKDRDGKVRVLAYDWKTDTKLERAVIPTKVHTVLRMNGSFVSLPYVYATPAYNDELTQPYNVLTEVYTDGERTLHFIGVESAAVYLDGEYVDLRTALEQKRLTLNGLAAMCQADRDAGRVSGILEQNGGKLAMGYAIAVTYEYGVNEYNSVTVNNTLDGDRDIYIGPLGEDVQYGSSELEGQ